jgi:hypothetical protein
VRFKDRYHRALEVGASGGMGVSIDWRRLEEVVERAVRRARSESLGR